MGAAILIAAFWKVSINLTVGMAVLGLRVNTLAAGC